MNHITIEVPREERNRTVAVEELRRACERARGTRFSDISISWGEEEVFPTLSALISGDRGWLMLIRYDGDAGFSSRSSDRASSTRMIEFQLGNGQIDEYSESWTLPIEEVLAVLEHFCRFGIVPAFVRWSNDSGDGAISPNDRDYTR